MFDTETTRLEPMPKNFVFGVVYGHNYTKVLYSVEDFHEEFRHKRYQNKYVFAHNAEFDLLTIYGNIYTEVDNTAVFNGKFIMAKRDKVTFADSMNIFPVSVEKIGNLIGLAKLDNKKVKGAGLTPGNITQEDVDYCTRDCEIVWIALQRIFENVGAVRITLPSLAMFDFRFNYLKNDLEFSELVDNFYDSYYGGRTEAFYIGQTKAKVYDVNSLYPYAMRDTVFPDIKRLKHETRVDLKYFYYTLDQFEGMARVRVRHKDNHIGYLPYKDKKLFFPVGEYDTTVNYNELRFAIHADMIEVLKVYEITWSYPDPSPFTEFITTNYNLRMSSDDPLNRTIYKLKMNSLYGRFAMRLKMSTAYYDEIPFTLIKDLQDNDKYYDLKVFNQVRNDCFLITENEQFKHSFYSIPVYSSYITSAARIILLKALIDNEQNGLCYCDTDSVFLTGDFQGNVSEALGDFKLEDKTILEIRGLKNYTYESQSEVYDAIKGVSKNAQKVIDPVTGCTSYHSAKYYKTLQSLRQGKQAGQAYTMKKTLSGDYDKRIVNSDGTTKPIKL